MAPVSAQPLIHQDRGQLPTLPCPGAVAEEEASPVDIAFGMRPKLNALLGHDIATRQILRCCVEHVDQRFKLGGAEQALLDDLPRQFGNDAGRGQSNRGHGCGLHKRARMRGADGEDQSLRAEVGVDTDILADLRNILAQRIGKVHGFHPSGIGSHNRAGNGARRAESLE